MIGRLTIATAVLSCVVGAALAEPVLGLWRTQPDAEGRTGHVKFERCVGGFCGTVIAARGADGGEIVTPSVGRQVLSNLTPVADGVYEGSAYVPLLRQTFPARVEIGGGEMRLQACNAMGLCRQQRWTRLE